MCWMLAVSNVVNLVQLRQNWGTVYTVTTSSIAKKKKHLLSSGEQRKCGNREWEEDGKDSERKKDQKCEYV